MRFYFLGCLFKTKMASEDLFFLSINPKQSSIRSYTVDIRAVLKESENIFS